MSEGRGRRALPLAGGLAVVGALVGLSMLAAASPAAAPASAVSGAVVMEAETMTVRTVGGPDGPGWNLWSNGSVADDFSVPADGRYRIEVEARGRAGRGFEPEMEVRIDDRVVASQPVAVGQRFRTYRFEVVLEAGRHRVTVAFVNDPNRPDHDVDLIVDRLTIKREGPPPDSIERPPPPPPVTSDPVPPPSLSVPPSSSAPSSSAPSSRARPAPSVPSTELGPPPPETTEPSTTAPSTTAPSSSQPPSTGPSTTVGPVDHQRIFVDGATGDDGNDGRSPEQAVRTITRAAALVRGGGEVIIAPGTYYERPTFRDLGSSRQRPVLIRAAQPGTVIVAGTWRAAAEGQVRWRSEGGGVYSAPHDQDPLFGRYEDTFLFRFNSVGDLRAGRAGGVATPSHGFARSGGRVHVRLPGGVDPNGRSVQLSAGSASVIGVQRSPFVTIDGLRVVGGGRAPCISVDRGSTAPTIRNTVMEYCRFGARLTNDCLVEWSEYTYPGFRDFAEEIRRRNGSVRPVFDLVKDYHPDSWMEGGLAISFGRSAQARDCEFRYNFMHQAFDGEKLGTFEFSSSHHNVYLHNYDEHVEFEHWGGLGSRELRLHDSLLIGGGMSSVSHADASSPGLVGPHYVYRNVIYGYDEHGATAWTLIKSKVRNPAIDRIHYYHNVLWSTGDGAPGGGWPRGTNWLFWDGERRDMFRFRNNIIVFEGANSNRARGRFDSDHNLLVNRDDRPWMRGGNGRYLGPDPSALALVDVEALDFRPTADSPARDAGVALPGFNDGAPGGPDIGAFEVGQAIEPEWPRPARTVFSDDPPPRWSPG